MKYADIILETINTSETHMTAEQIFFKIKEMYPSVVLATIYNNLNSMYLQGKIRKISIEGCPDRYDKNTRHDHLICRKCGKLSDVHISDITKELEQQMGFAIEGYDLKIQYICPQCQSQQADLTFECRSKDL